MAVKTVLPGVLALILNLHGLWGQTTPTVDLGSSITAGSNASWVSSSGDFAFGFHPLSASGAYLLGIWFEKIPEKTLVWAANRYSPAEGGSKVELASDGRLQLTYLNGSVQRISEASARAGFMQDNGNFVLKDAVSNVVWSSFDLPTDTLLPEQELTGGKKLYSNSNGTVNYSPGNFMLEMQSDGNLVLSAYHFADPGYWISDTQNVDGVRLIFNQSASMYLVNGTNHKIRFLTSNMPTPVEDYYHRATLDDQGIFQQFVYHKTEGRNWTRIWRLPVEPCLVNTICGVYGFCTSPDNETVTCNCLPGYTPLNPNIVSKGCRPETVVNYCAEPSFRNFTVEVIDDADFPPESFADLARTNVVDVEECKKAVMDDCYSLAAVLYGSTCNKKRMPLLNGRNSTSTKGIKALVKVPMKRSNPGIQKGNRKSNSQSRTALEIGLIISAITAFLCGAAAIYYNPSAQRLIKRKKKNSMDVDINFREFTFQELHEASDGFSKILGRGSSGKVYSGKLSLKDAQIEIAVKKLEKDIDKSKEEFMTELKIIGRSHHRNLVRMLGFCNEKDQYLLVYELMPNRTLSDFLFGEGKRPGWLRRAEMAFDIARGLLYLHEECETQIIHCDIKPQNVLLDMNYTAKISDFGLSKLLNKDQTRTDTNMRGTIGYIAPEWLKNVPVTTKVDIFSFGVMLLEIICCRRHIELNRVEEESEEDDLVLSDWVLSCIVNKKLEMVVGYDPEVSSDFKRFERMAMVGLWCIHPDPNLRPSMKKVTQMLEGELEVAIPPLLRDAM
ncbi:G-type lectin S-receptor-like serine/threonine-protein kinase LECRK4 [Mangifera indica]|uniref:G-type lectin S-receptor-like serine/threonine-protein kinase LECRK4 n=1 Tax=Mangifera indica TaxID=29780 RepID=UPI001CF96D0C|nr:G-type lectin S-receptor-like serine/threonine-protein kinase LECRK4 [Mangifera indica]